MENSNLTLVSVRDGVVYTSSLQVAYHFGKLHKNVLDKIRLLAGLKSSRPNWFVETTYIDEQGKTRPCYDMTRQGFVQLVMGFTGEEANEFQVKYIEAFDEMEERLRNMALPAFPAEVALIGFCNRVEKKIDRLETKIDDFETKIDSKVVWISQEVRRANERLDSIVPRREFGEDAKRQYRLVVRDRYRGECPSCRREKIAADDGSALAGLNYDHHKGREKNSAEDGWAVCNRCNLELRRDDFRRDKSEDFVVFQKYRRQLFAKQKALPSQPKQLGLF